MTMPDEETPDELSDPEKHVAGLLDDLGIRYVPHMPVIVKSPGYDSETFQVYIDENGKKLLAPAYGRKFPNYYIMKPDFYLLDFHIYVEVMCGGTKKDYANRKKTYKENDIPIVFLDYHRPIGWMKYLILELKDISGARNHRLPDVIAKAAGMGLETEGSYL